MRYCIYENPKLINHICSNAKFHYANTLVAPGVIHRTVYGCGKDNFVAYTKHLEISCYLKTPIALLFYGGALEFHFREIFNVEVFGGFQVLIALVAVRVDAGC